MRREWCRSICGNSAPPTTLATATNGSVSQRRWFPLGRTGPAGNDSTAVDQPRRQLDPDGPFPILDRVRMDRHLGSFRVLECSGSVAFCRLAPAGRLASGHETKPRSRVGRPTSLVPGAGNRTSLSGRTHCLTVLGANSLCLRSATSTVAALPGSPSGPVAPRIRHLGPGDSLSRAAQAVAAHRRSTLQCAAAV